MTTTKQRRVPEGIAYHGFNKGRADFSYEDLPIVRFSPGLQKMGFAPCTTICKLAAECERQYKGRVFYTPGLRHTVLRCFAVENEVRMRVSVEPCPEAVPALVSQPCDTT